MARERPASETPPDRGVTDRSPTVRDRRLLAGCATGWLLLTASMFTHGDVEGVGRAAAAILGLVAIVALGRWRPFRHASTIAVGLYAAGLTGATLLAGVTSSTDGDASRLMLFTGNPNILGAALVTAMTAWAAVAPGRRWVWWAWPFVALAVLNTGSRTSGGALLAAATAWLVVRALRVPRRLLLAPLVALIVLAGAAFGWQRLVVESTPNLLAAPSDLTHGAWRNLAERVAVTDDAGPGPFEGTRAQRLVAQANDGSFAILYQSIGRSETGVPYVASVYLRSDTPQAVVLTSHLARVTCEVDDAWRRCVTPVGYGDDRRQRQFHLRTVERGGMIDVHVFGAQYERGTEVTPFLDTRPAWLPQTMVNRFDLRRITFLPENRVTAWNAGLDLAREHPWFGVGRVASADALLERTRPAGSPVTYAHNLAIELLAVHGAVGFLGAVLVLASLLAALRPSGWARLAPLLVGLALLNTWDLTLFDWPVAAPAVLAVGTLTNRCYTRARRGP